MKVYDDGDHYVIAESPEDADAVFREMKHPMQAEWDPDATTSHTWKEVETVPRTYFEEIIIDGVTVCGSVSGPASAFVSILGRGLLGSRECCNAS